MDVVPPPSNPYVGRLASLIASAKTQPSSFSGSRSELDKLANMVVTGSNVLFLMIPRRHVRLILFQNQWDDSIIFGLLTLLSFMNNHTSLKDIFF